MKKINVLSNILFWLTLASPIVTFGLASSLGEVEIFEVGGVLRYSFVMWFGIPVALLSLWIGILLKREKEKYKKNIVVALVCIPLLLIFGSFRFIFNTVTFDAKQLNESKEIIGFEVPEKSKSVTIPLDDYEYTIVKFSDEGVERIEKSINTSEHWSTSLSTELRGELLLPVLMQAQSYDKFLFYDYQKGIYNEIPDTKTKCALFAYDTELQRMLLVCGYLTNG